MRVSIVAWVIAVGVPLVTVSGPVLGEDWAVRRSDFDPRVVARYKALLEQRPQDRQTLHHLVSLYRKHRTVAALVREYVALAKKAPQAFAYQVILGELRQGSGETALALECYERAATLRPKDPLVAESLGGLYSKLGKTQEARTAYERALQLSASSRDKERRLRALAGAALSGNDLDAARRYYDQLVALAPKNRQVRLELAQALARGDHPEEALQQYETILKQTGDSASRADVLKEIGALQAKLGRETDAVATYRQAMALTASGHWIRRELTERIISIHRQKEDLRGLIATCEKTWQHRGHFEHDVLGRLYDETGDETKALASYRSALKALPQAVDTRVRLISLLERSGQDKEVLAEYRRLVALAPGDPKYQLELAKRLYRAGQQKEALKVLDACSARFSGDASVQSAVGDLFSRWGDQKRTMRVAQVLVRMEPKDPAHLINLGEQQFLQGHKRRALETWRRLLVSMPQKHAALAKLAEIYSQHEMDQEAIDLYSRAIKLSPKHLPYYRDLALLLERKQRTTDALRSWEATLALASSLGKSETRREARTHLIDILHRTYQLRHRLNAYHFVFDGPAPDIEAGFLLAEAYLKLGEDEKAAATYRRILTLRQDSLEAMTSLEAVYRRQRKLEPAIALLKRLAELRPGGAPEYYQRVADLLLQLYRDKEALVYAHQAVALGHQDATSYQRLGELYEKKEDYEGAAKAYARAIQIDPGRVRVLFALAKLHTQRGQYSEAEKLYRQVIRTGKTPESVAKAFRLGVDLSSYLGTLDVLEKDILPLSVTGASAETYRRLLVQIYERRVPLLIDQVRQGDPRTRERTGQELRQIGVRGIASLLEELSIAPRPSRRLIRMIGYLGNPNAVLSLLRVAEKEPEEEVTAVYGTPGTGTAYGPYYYSSGKQARLATATDRRAEAILAVGRIADPRAVAGLTALLRNRTGLVREAAAWALSRIRDPGATTALHAALGDELPAVEMMACAGLGVQGAPESRPVLEEVMMDPERSPGVRSACAWGLGALGDIRAAPSLMEILHSGEEDLQRAAAWSLGAMGQREAAAPLLGALWSKRAEVRRIIVWALSRIASGRTAIPRLTTPDLALRNGKLDDERFVVRLTETDEAPGPALSPSLVGLLQAHQSTVAEALHAALGRHRDVVLRVLGDLDGSPDRLSLAPLTSTREQLPLQARTELDRVVAAIGARLAGPVATLTTHRDLWVRRRAISVFGKIGATDVMRHLGLAWSRGTWEIRVAAMEAMATAHRRGAVSDAAALSFTAGSLHSVHWREREAAVEVLASLGRKRAAPLLATALRDANGFVRETAVRALGQVGGAVATAGLFLALGDEIPQVRVAACQAVAHLRAPNSRSRVAPLVRDPSPDVSRAAAAALRVLP
jgi:tetratricopeptide (TPR) repeat protein/HEAT repeat protein